MEKKQYKQNIAVDPPAVAKKIHVPTYDEILERIRSRYPRRSKSIIDKEIARLQITYDILISKTNFVRDLVKLLDSLHPFYWRLIEIDFDRQKIRAGISCISKSRKLASKFFEKYRFLIMASSTRKELYRVSSEGRGRILSTLKKCKRYLDYLRDLVVFIQHLPSIDANLPTIIVAGAPSTGKSTLVRNVSRAQTKVASYPFTTKKIHIGHFLIEKNNKKVKLQIIDTPGILDRDPNDMNQVERRAVAALQELEGVIVFLIDVSPSMYMSIRRQFRLLYSIINIYSKNKDIFIIINKIDEKDIEAYNEALRISTSLKEAGAVKDIFELVATDPEKARNIIKKISEYIDI